MAREVFTNLFGGVTDGELPHLFGSLFRFCEYDDERSRILLRANDVLGLEFPPANWPKPGGPPTAPKIAESVDFVRQYCLRLCDWVEACCHWQTHLVTFYEPQSFDPDPEKRELAALGVNQRFFADLNASQREWWSWRHEEVAGRFKGSPKWPTLGRSMAATPPEKPQGPPPVDQVIIMFWPLVKRHGWTYRDLMNVINAIAPVASQYPYRWEQELATYCANVLGLRKGRKIQGKSAPDGRPPGFEVAWKLCQKEGGPGGRRKDEL